MSYEGPKKEMTVSVCLVGIVCGILQHLPLTLMEPLLGLMGCVVSHCHGAWSHNLTFKFPLVCCSLHAENESHLTPLYLFNSPVFLPFLFGCHCAHADMCALLAVQTCICTHSKVTFEMLPLMNIYCVLACLYVILGTTLVQFWSSLEQQYCPHKPSWKSVKSFLSCYMCTDRHHGEWSHHQGGSWVMSSS